MTNKFAPTDLETFPFSVLTKNVKMKLEKVRLWVVCTTTTPPIIYLCDKSELVCRFIRKHWASLPPFLLPCVAAHCSHSLPLSNPFNLVFSALFRRNICKSNTSLFQMQRRPLRVLFPLSPLPLFSSIWLLLIILFADVHFAHGCPFQVRAFCECDDHVDGVQLNCSAPTAAEGHAANGTSGGQLGKMKGTAAAAQMMQILRSSQAHLGLLKVLSIHSTPIKVLSNNFFSGLYIRRLELVNCEIELLEKGAFGGLESVLQELAINGNRIKEVLPETVAGFHSLVRLDLSNNSIEELKAEHSLPRMPKLTEIDLSHNRISAIHKTFFDGVKSTVQTINLGHNTIAEVPASAIRGFRMLMALHLHNNELHGTLPALSFMNLPVLSLLNLAGNQISAIHRQAFLNAPMLRYLYLSANQLTQIQPFQLSSFERLEMLDLSNNWLEVLENDSFAGLPSLRQLYLGENHIKSIEPFAFSQNSTIAVLILEHNWMAEVTKDNFRPLRQLQQLSLKSNKLKSVDVAAFQGNPSLVMLDLSRNELIDLSPGTFLSQLNLLLVDLSFNKIVRTPFGAFGRRIATVLLQENPLVCDERIHMLQQGNGVFIPNSDDRICGQTTTISTPQLATVSEIESLIADHAEDGTLEEVDEAEESAFVQQLSTITPEGPSDELMDPVDSLNSGRMSNIRPIGSIRHKTTVQPASSERSAASVRNDKSMAPIQQTKTTAPTAEPNQFFVGATQIKKDTDNKLSKSAPISLTEKIENGEEIVNGGAREVQQQTFAIGSEEATTNTVSAVTVPSSTTTVDPRNNPAVIYPHPVPFLASGPKLHTAHSIKSDENGNSIQTLPPNIVMASRGEEQILPRPTEESGETGKREEEKGENDQNHQFLENSTNANGEGRRKWEQIELRTSTNNGNEVGQNSAEVIGEDGTFSEGKFEEESAINAGGNSRQKSIGKPLPTTVIALCLSTVGVVMFAVFVGMCVAKKRQMRALSGGRASDLHSLQHSPNSNAYMSAAVAARAAQLNGLIYGAMPMGDNGTMGRTMQRGGTMSRSRSNSSNGTALPMSRMAPSQEDIYGWIYGQHAYNSYAK